MRLRIWELDRFREVNMPDTPFKWSGYIVAMIIGDSLYLASEQDLNNAIAAIQNLADAAG